MQVEAIYHNGKLEFIPPLHLKHERMRVVVTVPDHEVELPPLHGLPAEVIERARMTLARMEAIKNAPLPPDEYLPDLTEKQLERIDAFALRDEIKGLR